jgi:hypothetical protein
VAGSVLLAVAKSLDKLDHPKTEQPCDEKSDDSHCKSPFADADGRTLVIGVTVSGEPYAENAEFRRRLRYAVVGGLESAGFVPKEQDHIGYFRPFRPVGPQLPANPKLPTVIPLEWFVSDSSSSKILVL